MAREIKDCKFSDLVNGKWPYYDTIHVTDVVIVDAIEIKARNNEKMLMLVTDKTYNNTNINVVIFMKNFKDLEVVKRLLEEIKKGPITVDIMLEKRRSMSLQYPFTLVTPPYFSGLKIKQSTASLYQFDKEDYRITTLSEFTTEAKRD